MMNSLVPLRPLSTSRRRRSGEFPTRGGVSERKPPPRQGPRGRLRRARAAPAARFDLGVRRRAFRRFGPAGLGRCAAGWAERPVLVVDPARASGPSSRGAASNLEASFRLSSPKEGGPAGPSEENKWEVKPSLISEGWRARIWWPAPRHLAGSDSEKIRGRAGEGRGKVGDRRC